MNKAKLNTNKDIIDDLSEEQLRRLDESIQQVKDGKVIKHDVMKERIARWFSYEYHTRTGKKSF